MLEEPSELTESSIKSNEIEECKSIESDRNMNRRHFIEFSIYERPIQRYIEKPKMRVKTGNKPMQSQMLGGMLYMIQRS